MSSRPSRALDSRAIDETEVRALYRQILHGWNRCSADDIAMLCDEDADVIECDGAEFKGRGQIASAHRQIFAERPTGVFVGKVRGVRFLEPNVAVLSAIAGMVMPGQSDFDPERNVVQRLVAVKRDGVWQAAVFQTTPAQFHERPEEALALTEDLRKLL